MSLTIATWNINSVRLRIGNVERFLKLRRPDVLCLQETKCPDEFFPHAAFEALGYSHRLVHGMKAYNGVAIVSKIPFTATTIHHRCGKEDCRHIEAALDLGADPILLDNLYIPAGGDEPDPEINVKFRHKLDFLDEMRAHEGLRPAAAQRALLVGDLNVAPLEHDVWSHKQMLKVVSHTPVECEKLGHVQKAGGWIDSMRVHTPEPEKLYTWWSYRAMDNWKIADRGRRLDHVWTSNALADRVSNIKISKDYRGAAKPSDHVPVTATVEI